MRVKIYVNLKCFQNIQNKKDEGKATAIGPRALGGGQPQRHRFGKIAGIDI